MSTQDERFRSVVSEIDAANQEDPNKEGFEGKFYSKEYLYSQRMSAMLSEYMDDPDELMSIAARGQHIRRWTIPRNEYPMDRKGYLQWRTKLKMLHGELLGNIMEKHGYSEKDIDHVQDLVTKKRLKNDPQTQQLEDVICLVFLKYYFEDFATKHEESKVLDILQKTWKKMTKRGREIAVELPLSPPAKVLLNKALAI